MSEHVAVTYLFSRECPSHRAGRALIDEAASAARVHVDVEEVEVRSDAQAESLRFPGSPTYLLEGTDIAQPDPSIPHRIEVCRAYEQPDGRIGPLPAVSQLVAALAEAAGHSHDHKVPT